MLHSIFKNLFTVLCVAITLFLISDLLVTSLIKKPTTTTKIKKELETSDLPNVVVCLDPGFDNATAVKYGYHVSYYWTGLTKSTRGGGRFVGWNGDRNENMSSRAILEEMFLFPGRQEIVREAVFFTENYDQGYKSDVSFRHLFFPHGRCMFSSPPSFNKTPSRKKINIFNLAFNNSAFDQAMLSSAKLKVFLMDQASSPQFYHDEFEMDGDPIEIPFEPGIFIFKKSRDFLILKM